MTLLEDLVAQGAPVLQADDHGNTVIHQVIEQSAGHKPTVLDRIARALISSVRPKAINIRNNEGQTLLHLASTRHNLWIAKYLLRHGADVNARDNQGNTPLHYAGYKDMRDELLKHGADVSITNHDGQTPISYQINFGSMIYKRLCKCHKKITINFAIFLFDLEIRIT